MAGTTRFFTVAVCVAVALWLVAYALNLHGDYLRSVFGVAGVLVASIVEFFLKRREPARPPSSPATGRDER